MLSRAGPEYAEALLQAADLGDEGGYGADAVGEGDGRDEAPEELGEQVFGPEDVRYALER